MACRSSASEIKIEIESPGPPPNYSRAANANDFEASTSFSTAASSAFEIETENESRVPHPDYPRAANDFEASTSAYTAASSAFEIEIVSESRAPPTDYPRAANDFEASTSAYTAANDFGASTSSSTAVYTNENSHRGPDIFICHRGPNIKNPLARLRLLVHHMRHHVRAFLDKLEMQEGEYFLDVMFVLFICFLVYITVSLPSRGSVVWVSSLPMWGSVVWVFFLPMWALLPCANICGGRLWGKIVEEAVPAVEDEAENTASRGVRGVGVLDDFAVTSLPHFLWGKIAEEAAREEVGSVEGREGLGGEEMGGEGVSEDEGDE